MFAVLSMTEKGWKMISEEDSKDLFYKYQDESFMLGVSTTAAGTAVTA
jgi:hypothetical protein